MSKLSSSRLQGEANVLVMPNLDAANIAFQLTGMLADALPVGPILIRAAKPAHILNRAITVRGVVEHDLGGGGGGTQVVQNG